MEHNNMKAWRNLGLVFLIVTVLLPMGSAWAQTSAKKALPQVPITIPGDTEETIKRRAQWIDAAKKEGNLDWWGMLKLDDAAKVIAEFNKIYPFITVNYWSGRGEEIAAKLEAEYAGGRFSVDLVLGGEPNNYPRWRKMGMLEKFTDVIPGIKRIDKRMYSKYNDWVQPGNVGTAPEYNTSKVSAMEAPKSWEDLLDPKWKEQIGLTKDTKLWEVIALDEGGWGIEKTESYLNKLKQQQLIWAASFATGHTLVMSGEFKILGQSYLHNIFRGQEKKAPVEWSRVSPVIVHGPSFLLQKRGPHPNAARLLLEWLFSPQGLVSYEKITYYGLAAPGSGTKLAKELEGLPLVYQTEEIVIKSVEMGLDKRFAKILGITPD